MDSLRALSRALGEMNQFLPEVVSDSLRRRLSQTLDDDRFLRAKPGRGPKDVSMRDRPRWPGSDVRDDIHACLQRAAACGLDVLVLNQTRPEIGAPVARVVVPGLRHFWPRLGPGRLYTVPVQLGWLETARDERDLTRAAFLI